MHRDNRNLVDHTKGIAVTLLFHGAVILLFFLIVFHTPIPPWPEEGGGGGGNGLEVNLGTSDEGIGTDPGVPVSVPDFATAKVQPSGSSSALLDDPKTGDELLEQDIDESAVIRSAGQKQNKASDRGQKREDQKVNAQPEVDTRALYRKKSASSDGTTAKPGNQGREDGNAGSRLYGGTGTGHGTGDGSGSGTGSGSGSGSGTGSGIGGGTGSGWSVDLGGRQAKSIRKPSYQSEEQGKIVVTIKVNREGKVVSAVAGAKGTTLPDQGLWRMAENAAMESIFAASPSASEEQRGTLTYIFRKVR